MWQKNEFKTELDLLTAAQALAGKTLREIADGLQISTPDNLNSHKGWVGQLLEIALGATAGSKALPDFHELGVELKTLPINSQGQPKESTYVTMVPLITQGIQSWETSEVWLKLRRVLWIPYEFNKDIPLGERCIGMAFLWSPTLEEQSILKKDWEELMTLVTRGELGTISATLGEYLQIRPKGANRHSLREGLGEEGQRILTLPRGFYLRASFTKNILNSAGFI